MTKFCFPLFFSLAFLGILLESGRAEDIDNLSHLTLPRFASLRSGDVNMRTGPGTRYPIEWVYTRRGLPVEIIAEYDIWRQVRDVEGSEGWVNKTELSGKRGVIVKDTLQELYKSPTTQSAIVAHLQGGAIGQLLSCTADWCKVKFDDVKGYLAKPEFWGSYPNEIVD